MNKFHSFTTSWTYMFAIHIFSPITNISALIIEQTRLTFEYFIFATITKMICGAIIWIRIESWLFVRTFYCAVYNSGFRRYKRGTKSEFIWYCLSGNFCCCRRCSAYSFSGPHALLVWFRIPQTVCAFQNSVNTG
jgi:hypothetical protein